MSPELPVRPRGAGLPAWQVALVAGTVLVALVLLLASGFAAPDPDEGEESSFPHQDLAIAAP